MVNDTLGRVYSLVKPVTVEFKIKVDDRILTVEGLFKDLMILTVPYGNLGDDKVMTPIKTEYILSTDKLLFKKKER